MTDNFCAGVHAPTVHKCVRRLRGQRRASNDQKKSVDDDPKEPSSIALCAFFDWFKSRRGNTYGTDPNTVMQPGSITYEVMLVQSILVVVSNCWLWTHLASSVGHLRNCFTKGARK